MAIDADALGIGVGRLRQHLAQDLIALRDHHWAGHGVRVHRAPPFFDRTRVAIAAGLCALEAAEAAPGHGTEWQGAGRHVVREHEVHRHRQQKQHAERYVRDAQALQ